RGTRLHAGDDAGSIGVAFAHDRLAVLERGLPETRVEHGAELDIAHVAAGADDDALAGADADDRLVGIDIAVRPPALEPLAGLGVEARRIARDDADDAAVLALTDDRIHVAVEDELNALLARAVFERAGHGPAAEDIARRAEGGRG